MAKKKEVVEEPLEKQLWKAGYDRGICAYSGRLAGFPSSVIFINLAQIGRAE